jgi:hypothetical protein
MPALYRVDIDATYLRFDPSKKDFYEKICADIPAFAEYQEHAKPTLIRIFAWIVCMYDMNTPLRREIKDMYKRKVYAATLTGLTPNKVSGKYKEEVEKMMTGQDPKINNLIVQYISSFSSPEYMQLMAHASLQHSVLNRIITGDVSKDNQIIFDNATDKIKELTNLIYGTGERDEVYEARRALYHQVAADLSDMRAENVSKTMVVDGSLPDEWNPYGDGYIPDEIHFAGDDPDIAKEDEE